MRRCATTSHAARARCPTSSPEASGHLGGFRIRDQHVDLEPRASGLQLIGNTGGAVFFVADAKQRQDARLDLLDELAFPGGRERFTAWGDYDGLPVGADRRGVRSRRLVVEGFEHIYRRRDSREGGRTAEAA